MKLSRNQLRKLILRETAEIHEKNIKAKIERIENHLEDIKARKEAIEREAQEHADLDEYGYGYQDYMSHPDIWEKYQQYTHHIETMEEKLDLLHRQLRNFGSGLEMPRGDRSTPWWS